MGAVDLLAYFRTAGFTLDLADHLLLVKSASMLTDELRTALSTSKPEVLALLAVEHEANAEAFCERAIVEFGGRLPRAAAKAAARQCVDCEFFGRRRTCREPVAAGLLTQTQGFSIVWPPEGHDVACLAFFGKVPKAAADRTCRLTNDKADRCHVSCWDDGEMAAFTTGTTHFVLLGRADADDLAERLTPRDCPHDDRRLCLECAALADNGRCLVAARGRLPGAARRLEPVLTILHRCPGFTLAPGLT
jgi:hypothetical protein